MDGWACLTAPIKKCARFSSGATGAAAAHLCTLSNEDEEACRAQAGAAQSAVADQGRGPRAPHAFSRASWLSCWTKAAVSMSTSMSPVVLKTSWPPFSEKVGNVAARRAGACGGVHGRCSASRGGSQCTLARESTKEAWVGAVARPGSRPGVQTKKPEAPSHMPDGGGEGGGEARGGADDEGTVSMIGSLGLKNDWLPGAPNAPRGLGSRGSGELLRDISIMLSVYSCLLTMFAGVGSLYPT